MISRFYTYIFHLISSDKSISLVYFSFEGLWICGVGLNIHNYLMYFKLRTYIAQWLCICSDG